MNHESPRTLCWRRVLAALLMCSAAMVAAPGRGAEPAPQAEAQSDPEFDPGATPGPATREGGDPVAEPDRTGGPDTAAAMPRAASSREAADRLELDTTVVTGNRELPKVLYIVPWKKADLGDLPAQPFNTLLDEVLTPVDRDVFRREVTYYDAIARGADATQSTSRAPR